MSKLTGFQDADYIPRNIEELLGTDHKPDREDYVLSTHAKVGFYCADGWTVRGEVKDCTPDPLGTMIAVSREKPRFPTTKYDDTMRISGLGTFAQQPEGAPEAHTRPRPTPPTSKAKNLLSTIFPERDTK